MFEDQSIFYVFDKNMESQAVGNDDKMVDLQKIIVDSYGPNSQIMVDKAISHNKISLANALIMHDLPNKIKKKKDPKEMYDIYSNVKLTEQAFDYAAYDVISMQLLHDKIDTEFVPFGSYLRCIGAGRLMIRTTNEEYEDIENLVENNKLIN